MVTGACVFSGQPFYCAASHFNQDTQVPQTADTRVPFCDGCAPNMTLPFDHCKKTPDSVDVGSLVDYPRRHCGQNPIFKHECFDDVDFLKPARVFLFRGTADAESAPGAVENVAGLLAQMSADPDASIKLVADQPFGAVLPLASTPHAGRTDAAGYDGPGECLRHVFDAPWLKAGRAIPSSWEAFDQAPYAEPGVGFQKQGWIYVPERCRAGSGAQVCKLVVRPDTCAPPTSWAPDMAAFADYAETNAMVVLAPCLGGAVDKTRFPHAPDVEAGKLDVYGQLTQNYVEQSAPHMRAIGKMVRHVLGVPQPAPPPPAPAAAAAAPTRAAPRQVAPSDIVAMPTLKIDSAMSAGCSNTADFSHQFHVAFSSIIKGSCIFSGMPFHCAVTRFPSDYMVPKARSTAAGIKCPDCADNGTLIYDHCKNHPRWVDVSMLQKYAEAAEGVDDPTVNLADARVFSFGPTHDRCYQPPSMENVANFHLKYAKDPEQVKLVEDQPFPHTLPTNSTPFFNDVGNTTGAGYDGPGECLKHVFGRGQRLYPAEKADPSWWLRINATEFVPADNLGQGMKPEAWLFVPPPCNAGRCKLLVLPGGCNAWTEDPPGETDDWARYGAANGIVILKPCQGGSIDQKRFPDNHENLRGMVDVYGQLSADYATQNGGQMKPIGAMVKRIMGMA